MSWLTRWSRGTRSLSVILAGPATAALLVTVGGTALAAPSGTRASAGASAAATANPANGTVHVDWASPGTGVRMGIRAKGSGYACVIQTKRHARLEAYQPTTLFRDANSYEFDWLFAPYSVRHARFVDNKPTFQVQLCETGNGHSWKKWDVNRVNAFYLSSHVFKWQGTGSPEGDVGHALYEFDTTGTVDFGYAVAVQVQLLCARVIGNCVKA